MQVVAAQINPTICDLKENVKKILQALDRARNGGADVILFPELTITGYFPDDLLFDAGLIQKCEEILFEIAPFTKNLFAVIGTPRRNESGKEKRLFNSAAIFMDGKLEGFQDKILLPTYDVFDERRYFEPGKKSRLWKWRGKTIVVTICEDLWQHSYRKEWYSNYAIDPVEKLQGETVDLVLNLSGSPYHFSKRNERVKIFQKAARTLSCPVILCNQVGANDQLIFDGHSLYVDETGALITIAQGFQEQDLWIDLKKSQSPLQLREEGIENLYAALVLGVRDYFQKQGFQKAHLGLSGGVDSALVAHIAKDALGKENVVAITMPSRYSSPGSLKDSLELAKKIGIELQEISIEPIFQAYLELLKKLLQGDEKSETQENLQTRIRGMILMAFSNRFGSLLLNTGNKSEMAMGYCTLYGDMAGGLGVLQDVLKLKVFALAEYVGISSAILDKAPSAELKENQTDQDTLPPYEILDPILEDYLEYGLSSQEIAEKRKTSFELVEKIIHKVHEQEYKRRQAPIGIRVTQKAFSKGRIVPIVQKLF